MQPSKVKVIRSSGVHSGWAAESHSWTSEKLGLCFQGLYEMSIKVERGEKRTCNKKTFCDAENWRGSLHAGVLSYITEYIGLRETGIPPISWAAWSSSFEGPRPRGSNVCNWNSNNVPSPARLFGRHEVSAGHSLCPGTERWQHSSCLQGVSYLQGRRPSNKQGVTMWCDTRNKHRAIVTSRKEHLPHSVGSRKMYCTKWQLSWDLGDTGVSKVAHEVAGEENVPVWGRKGCKGSEAKMNNDLLWGLEVVPNGWRGEWKGAVVQRSPRLCRVLWECEGPLWWGQWQPLKSGEWGWHDSTCVW